MASQLSNPVLGTPELKRSEARSLIESKYIPKILEMVEYMISLYGQGVDPAGFSLSELKVLKEGLPNLANTSSKDLVERLIKFTAAVNQYTHKLAATANQIRVR